MASNARAPAIPAPASPKEAAASPTESGHSEWAGLSLLCGALLVYWAVQYQPFLLPNNDYYSFERTAQSIAAGELPGSFKRMPLFPALMALLAPLLPASHAHLHAALVWNQAFSLGTLILLFLLARGLIGRGAILLPTLFASTAQFHAMGLQPLVEPSLGFFVVAAFELHRRGSRWQYAAAAAAALSRYEAGLLIPVLCAVNIWGGRRVLGHLALAGIAALGCVGWAALGAREGSGGGFYFQLMEGMGWQPAPGFALRALREPFRGWWLSRAWSLPFLLLMVGLPLAVGIARGRRQFPRETVALLAFWTLSVVTIVGFGVNKARYVYYTQWIPLFFWVAGLAPLTRAVLDRVRRIAPLPARVWALLAAALLALVVVAWGVRLGAPRHVAPLGAELGFFALALGLTGLAAWRQAGPSLPLALLLVVAAAPLVGGGLVGKRDALYKVHHANHSAWLLASWLAENLKREDRVVLLPRAHVVHLTGISPGRLVPFSSLEAESPTELARLMRERGLTHVAYTYRGSVRNPSQAYYYRIKNVALAEFFSEGADVPGFEHLARLPLPIELSRPAVQVYRLRPARPTAG